MSKRLPLSVYVHIPFCKVHCPYCDFYTYPADRGRSQEFVDALGSEISMADNRLVPDDYEISTIYFGGGTPSTLSARQLGAIIDSLQAKFAFTATPEITLEANPDDVNQDIVQEWKSIGINRVSLGVQSRSPEVLRYLGRVHSDADTDRAFGAMADFPNWSVDLMFGWEGHTHEQWEQELASVIRHEPPHMSLYQLTLEPQTRFGVLADMGRVAVVNNDIQADLYHMAVDRLAERSIHQYEVCSFARAGFESRHNQSYWHRLPYLGLGPAAASFLWSRRTLNVKSLPQYVKFLRSMCSVISSVEVITPDVAQRERVWLGLRTSCGVPRHWMWKSAHSLIDQMRREGLLADMPNDHIGLTRSGMAVADEITRRLLLTRTD